MPVYEFLCGACGTRFQVLSSIAERDEKAVCPDCGSREVAAVLGAFAVGGHKGTLNPGTFERPARGKGPVHRPGKG